MMLLTFLVFDMQISCIKISKLLITGTGVGDLRCMKNLDDIIIAVHENIKDGKVKATNKNTFVNN